MFSLQLFSASRVYNFVYKVVTRVNSAIRECAASAATNLPISAQVSKTERLCCSAWQTLACPPTQDYIGLMCGRIIQSSGPLRYALVDGITWPRLSEQSFRVDKWSLCRG